jgi:tryptophan-rich sensory protein
MSLVRWALVTIPSILLLGIASGRLANSGEQNAWYAALVKPEITPPGWFIGLTWTVLYMLMGLALAMILHARGARGRGTALGLFAVQLLANLAWSPLFFAAHQITLALGLLGAIWLLANATTFAFGRIRPLAAWLMVPYLMWLTIAGALNFQLDQLNPNAEELAPGTFSAQIEVVRP